MDADLARRARNLIAFYADLPEGDHLAWLEEQVRVALEDVRGDALEEAAVARGKIRFYEQADWHVNGATAAASIAQDIEALKESPHGY